MPIKQYLRIYKISKAKGEIRIVKFRVTPLFLSYWSEKEALFWKVEGMSSVKFFIYLKKNRKEFKS